MKEMILTREQRTIFNLHWKSVIHTTYARPVKAEVFAELIIMRYPIEDIRMALIRAFAPNMPQSIRTFINASDRNGTGIDEVALEHKILQSYGYENFMGLWRTINSLRRHYFGSCLFANCNCLPVSCNKLHISSKVVLQREQLVKIFKCLEDMRSFLLQRIEQMQPPPEQLSEEMFHAQAAEAQSHFELHNFGPRGEQASPIPEVDYVNMPR